ncbi:hypothetical protein R3P38DRAFT_2801049 [Favolaschia claudopus]|uniref:Uncharacterized protein n=1 Tax=Favolaschia claudopus TaxID=2862362 RepID=A0AAV9ZXA2_9AGAR
MHARKYIPEIVDTVGPPPPLNEAAMHHPSESKSFSSQVYGSRSDSIVGAPIPCPSRVELELRLVAAFDTHLLSPDGLSYIHLIAIYSSVSFLIRTGSTLLKLPRDQAAENQAATTLLICGVHLSAHEARGGGVCMRFEYLASGIQRCRGSRDHALGREGKGLPGDATSPHVVSVSRHISPPHRLGRRATGDKAFGSNVSVPVPLRCSRTGGNTENAGAPSDLSMHAPARLQPRSACRAGLSFSWTRPNIASVVEGGQCGLLSIRASTKQWPPSALRTALSSPLYGLAVSSDAVRFHLAGVSVAAVVGRVANTSIFDYCANAGRYFRPVLRVLSALAHPYLNSLSPCHLTALPGRPMMFGGRARAGGSSDDCQGYPLCTSGGGRGGRSETGLRPQFELIFLFCGVKWHPAQVDQGDVRLSIATRPDYIVQIVWLELRRESPWILAR